MKIKIVSSGEIHSNGGTGAPWRAGTPGLGLKASETNSLVREGGNRPATRRGASEDAGCEQEAVRQGVVLPYLEGGLGCDPAEQERPEMRWTASEQEHPWDFEGREVRLERGGHLGGVTFKSIKERKGLSMGSPEEGQRRQQSSRRPSGHRAGRRWGARPGTPSLQEGQWGQVSQGP